MRGAASEMREMRGDSRGDVSQTKISKNATCNRPRWRTAVAGDKFPFIFPLRTDYGKCRRARHAIHFRLRFSPNCGDLEVPAPLVIVRRSELRVTPRGTAEFTPSVLPIGIQAFGSILPKRTGRIGTGRHRRWDKTPTPCSSDTTNRRNDGNSA